MPQYDSSSFPLVGTVNQDDRVLFWQDAEGRNARVKFSNIAAFISSGGDQITISGLRAKDVSALSTGAASLVGGYYTLGDGGGGLFFYDATATDADNGGTIIEPDSGVGRWFRPATETYNVREFGALGDGSHNDTAAIQAAVDVVSVNNRGSVYIPSGKYKISATIELAATPDANIAIFGDGPDVSIINQTQVGSGGLDFSFKNTGTQQPYTCTIKDVGFETTVVAGTAILISYGNPASTSTHYNHGPLVTNVGVRSNDSGYWATGIDLESAWNAKITDCSISGSPFGGTWTSMIGSGIRLRRSCVNAHILNNSINFWFTGLYYSAEGAGAAFPNTEGLFCENNSMVAVRRGVWIQGNPTATFSRMTGFQWIGGLVELREGIAAIQLEACSEARVSGSYLIDASSPSSATVIGVYMGTCENVTINGNQIYAMGFGVRTTGTCNRVIVSANNFRGGGDQVYFEDGSVDCRSSLNITNTAETYVAEYNLSTSINSRNRVFQGHAYGFFAKKDANQSIPDSTDTAVTWQTTVYDDVVQALTILDPANPSRIYVPKGVSRVRLTVGIRWNTSAVGDRLVKIRTPVAGSYYPANTNWASDSRTATTLSDCTVSTGIINLDPVLTFRTTYFDVVVSQTSGGALDIRNAEGTYIYMEILG